MHIIMIVLTMMERIIRILIEMTGKAATSLTSTKTITKKVIIMLQGIVSKLKLPSLS